MLKTTHNNNLKAYNLNIMRFLHLIKKVCLYL